jgi:hypothetical protein
MSHNNSKKLIISEEAQRRCAASCDSRRANKIRTILPIRIQEVESKHLGWQLFPDRYCNILILASKKSGKTTALNHIVKNSMNPKDSIKIFASTVFKDPIYDNLIAWCASHNIPADCHEDFRECRINHLKDFMENSRFEDMDDEIQTGKLFLTEPDVFAVRPLCGAMNMLNLPNETKKESSDTTIILDDMGQDLRDISVENLLKTSRHHHSRVIISTQWLNDLRPASVRQLDYILLFRGLPDDKLIELHKKITTPTPIRDFLNIYRNCTILPYSFMYIDVKRGLYRRNFIPLNIDERSRT